MEGLAAKILVLAPALVVSAALAAQSERPSQELAFDSESFTLDGDSNLIHFVHPQITQGALRIDADEAVATGVEFDDRSEWRFTGNVRIAVDRVVIEADSAVFNFDKDQLARGELVGSPASFRASRPDSGKKAVEGTANKIFIDYNARTLRMSELVSLTKDQYYMQGCDLVFDLNSERVTPGPTECGELFRIVVNPRENTAGANPAASP